MPFLLFWKHVLIKKSISKLSNKIKGSVCKVLWNPWTALGVQDSSIIFLDVMVKQKKIPYLNHE